MTRRLIVIPIVHTATDLGSLSESVKAHYVEKFGPDVWEKRERLVEKLWDDIWEKIELLELDYPQVRLYQDGLPVCGHELKIVEELAGAGSRNHQLLLELLSRGATLVGTEDSQLLIREYQMHREQLASSDLGTRSRNPSANEVADLLEARDRFIAQRIATTLQEGEIGLVFLGAAHRLEALPDPDIQVETLTDAKLFLKDEKGHDDGQSTQGTVREVEKG